MEAGSLRHRISIQRLTPPVSNGGVPVPRPPALLFERIPADVQQGAVGPMSRVFAAQVLTTTTHLVRMRYRVLRTDDVIVWHTGAGDRTFRIQGQHGDAVNVELILAAVEIGA
jgi:hypothetical protein